MRKNAFVAKDHIQAINIFRMALNGESFTKEELRTTLKDGGIPSNEVFISALRRSPVLTQVGKDRFKFASTHPVYWGVLERVYKDYQVKTNTYSQTYREKKKRLALVLDTSAAQYNQISTYSQKYCKIYFLHILTLKLLVVDL